VNPRETRTGAHETGGIDAPWTANTHSRRNGDVRAIREDDEMNVDVVHRELVGQTRNAVDHLPGVERRDAGVELDRRGRQLARGRAAGASCNQRDGENCG
jgi:hypothetical protein